MKVQLYLPVWPKLHRFFMAQVAVKKAFDTVAEVVDARLDQVVRQATQRLELLMKKLDAAAKPQAPRWCDSRVCLKMGYPKTQWIIIIDHQYPY